MNLLLGWLIGAGLLFLKHVACVIVLLHSVLVEYWMHSPLYLQEMFLILVE